MISKRFRTDYEGEFVILKTVYRDGKKIQEREWIANPIQNQHLSGRAAIIGMGESRSAFDHTRLARHRGGLLGKKKLQTYGTGDTFQHMRLDFYVSNHRDRLDQVLAAGYQQDNVVYTSAMNCIRYPGEFYLIPYSPGLHGVANAAYLAAFDAHKEIFLLGVDHHPDSALPIEIKEIRSLVDIYDDVRWYVVSDHTTTPKSLLTHPRVQLMSYREFISYCDV